MCSNFENNELFENAEVPQTGNQKNYSVCKKCDKSSFVLLQKKDPFCKSCFYEYCRHKFRSTIGKSNLVPHKSNVLVAFSGGLSSSALTDLLIDSIQNPDSHKKLHLHPSFVFVNGCHLLCKERKDLSNVQFNEIGRMFKTGFKCFVTSLEMCFQSDGTFYEQITSETQFPLTNNDCQQKWFDSFESLNSLTAKEEYIRRTRHLLIMEIAKREKCPFVFLGSSGSRLAVNLLTDISQGKGNQLQNEVGFCDDRHEVKCLKPMREFVKKEILFWAKMRDVVYEEKRNLTTQLSKKATLSRLTESFITGLEESFPATVYTIVRTGNKLKPLANSSKTCSLCLSQVDEPKDNYSAIDALNDTLRLSRNSTNEDINKFENLCYGCKTMIRDSNNSANIIPELIRCKQREIIDDFLLK
ncbi:Cytoplasmic tRNA 2-thiolation protein 2 B-like protein [Leptotrombidium deliense]|uniref:Cytoplasmic tRNA 2-thiolation protein 2 n=1 Tax=Leptotrombidium deliense TaxID=299467 RepID=A0A443S130_9ACAR|nr:Cytoplasmic tRNA 2-thiolation protein 2 B-like protein [Leptotrombidium deliense]